jgi:deoxyribodipyrimidine photo-lyase
MASPILLWFRDDLRLSDHPALRAALDQDAPILPVYLHTPKADGRWERGGAANWWLHHALVDLKQQLEAKGSALILRSGKDPKTLLYKLFEETGASEIHWNRRYLPHQVEIDTELKKEFPATSHRGSMLFEPGRVQTQAGNPYKVFTPYYRALQKLGDPPQPLPTPREIPAPASWPDSEAIKDWNLLPDISWDEAFPDHWDPTEAGASRQLDLFLEEAAGTYGDDRDYPAQPGTSRLSPYLHFGQISPNTIWHEAQAVGGTEAYTRQLVWRDFARQMLFHFPHTDWEPLQEKYADFPFRKNQKWLDAWQKGQTGYPIVDAGMRQLWATGWMHNRVRMIVASFLVKDLLITWREGAEWFWDTLVDADLANNSLGWQWAAGCGADAAPYFRIFNPTRQSEKFDGSGQYIRRWIPELRHLPESIIHEPWNAPTHPEGYPKPIVDHKEARDRALEALNSIKES